MHPQFCASNCDSLGLEDKLPSDELLQFCFLFIAEKGHSVLQLLCVVDSGWGVARFAVFCSGPGLWLGPSFIGELLEIVGLPLRELKFLLDIRAKQRIQTSQLVSDLSEPSELLLREDIFDKVFGSFVVGLIDFVHHLGDLIARLR